MWTCLMRPRQRSPTLKAIPGGIHARGWSFVINVGAAATRKAATEGTRVTIFSLQEQAAKIIRARSGVPVYIKADQALNYGDVVRVMTVLQKAGAESIGLITDPPQQLGS